MGLPTTPGVYVEPADNDLWELAEDGLWRAVGRMLPFGGIDLQPGGPPLTPEQIAQNGVYPTERVTVPDHPPK